MKNLTEKNVKFTEKLQILQKNCKLYSTNVCKNQKSELSDQNVALTRFRTVRNLHCKRQSVSQFESIHRFEMASCAKWTIFVFGFILVLGINFQKGITQVSKYIISTYRPTSPVFPILSASNLLFVILMHLDVQIILYTFYNLGLAINCIYF